MSGDTLRPVSGDGVLSRHGASVVLCSPNDAADAVLAAHEEVAHAKGDASELADRIGAALAGTSGVGAVAFGPAGGSVLVAVFGHAWVDATTVHGEQRLALKAGTDGVRSVLPGALVSIRAGLGDPRPDAEPQRWGNLEHGVTHAGGLLFLAGDSGAARSGAVIASEPAPQPEPEPMSEPEPEPTAALEPADEPTAALRVADQPTDPEQAPEPAPETVTWPVGEPVGLAKHAEPEPTPEPEPEPTPEPPAPEPPAAEEPPALTERPPLSLPEPVSPVAPTEAADLPQPELVMPPPAPPAPATEPPTADVDRSRPFESVLLLPAAVAPQTETRMPLPVATVPEAPPAPEVAPPAHPVEDHGVQVLGVYCKNGHFNDPSARYCAVCGISMAQLTLVPRPGPRPPLGVLVLDDGSIFSLETDYVIGRDPSKDQRVLDNSARPLRLEDPKGLISRAHLQIKLDGWQVQVIDLGSANGTGVFGPGDTAWQPAPRLTPVAIRPGTQVGFGQRQLRYESHTNT